MDDFADRRLELQMILERITQSDHVYFQPPEDFKMSYPCIVYDFATFKTKHANNRTHHRHRKWTLTLIDPDSESPFLDVLSELPMCSHNRRFVSDHLYHDVFTLHY